MNAIWEEAQSLFPEIRAHRRYLHQNPGVAFDTEKARSYVKEQLEALGCSVRCCGKSGLVTAIGGKQPGKVLLLRADMDALPIPEESGESFASTNGAMHACGHDLHTAMLLGAAKLLKARESELPGTVKLMFQSAEETFQGARDMINDGVLEDPRPDAALMVHVTAASPLKVGTVVVSAPGVSAPAADYFTIQVQGKGCHGSAPEQGVDAITAGAHILLGLQEIHARELSASQEAVLTVGTFQGGTAQNAIADSALLGGTIRTYDEATRRYLKERIPQIASAIATAYRAQATVSFGSGSPTLVNDRGLSDFARRSLGNLLGKDMVLGTQDFSTDGKPVRGGGSEDFAYISQEIPALMLALPAGTPEDGYHYPQHHPQVRFDEAVLPLGTAVFTGFALDWLANP